MRYRTALLSSILAMLAAVLAVPGPATAAVPGFEVQLTELPGSFAVGGTPGTVTVVASTDVASQCQKVRWSMLLKVNGINLDQVSVDRVEDTGSFPLSVQANGDTARLTDVQVDPGELCPGRTVTAKYRFSFDREVTDGQVILQAEAYDTGERLLQLASATRAVVSGERAPEATPTEDAEPTPEATDEATDDEASGDGEESPEATPGTEPGEGDIASVPAASKGGAPSLLGAGVIVGAVLIFLGVSLLLRLRLRNKRSEKPDATRPLRPAG